MAYKVPEFPLVAAIRTLGQGEADPPRVLAPCNVAFGKRVTIQAVAPEGAAPDVLAQLLFPAGTDVRDQFSATGPDIIECPAGSKRWYHVWYVNDLGAGFPNEHRCAWCTKWYYWPTPLPPVFAEPVPGPA